MNMLTKLILKNKSLREIPQLFFPTLKSANRAELGAYLGRLCLPKPPLCTHKRLAHPPPPLHWYVILAFFEKLIANQKSLNNCRVFKMLQNCTFLLFSHWYSFSKYSIQINFIAKETSRAEPEYMNIHPPPQLAF